MTEKSRNRKGKPTELRTYFIIISIIIVFLILILIMVKISTEQTPEEISEYENNIIEQNTEDIRPESTRVDSKEKENNGTPKKDRTDTVKAPVKIQDNKPILVFVLDDAGNSIEQLRPFLKLPYPVTFAIMPDRRYTTQCASMITSAGKEYILHQPMEAVSGADPGESAIYNGMDENEIYRILKHNFAQLPSAGGMNNHMGSAATSNTETMRAVMRYLSDSGKFYLDSFTISNSVGLAEARKANIACIRRNSMFLDNESDRELIIEAIEEGKNTARKKGYAVMIGHVMTDELAEIMLELYPGFIEDGFTLKEISELFIEMNNSDIED